MRTHSRSAAVCIAVALCTARTGTAQSKPTTRDAIVVSPSWLSQHLHDPDLAILEVSNDSAYAAGHIPGARLVNGARLTVDVPGGLSTEMPSTDSLRAYFSAIGISDNSHIVVYFPRPGVTSVTRLVVTLDQAGFGSATAMLDGGLPAWTAAGNAVTKEIPPARVGSISAKHPQPVVVDANFVKAHIATPGFAIVDARVPAFYDGVQTGGSPPQRAGHIPGAFSIPYTTTYNPAGTWKTAAELEDIFTKAGIKPGDTVITYCHIGIQATAVLFAARTLGHPVLFYDGSFQDWSAHTDFPVENPAAKKQ